MGEVGVKRKTIIGFGVRGEDIETAVIRIERAALPLSRSGRNVTTVHEYRLKRWGRYHALVLAYRRKMGLLP